MHLESNLWGAPLEPHAGHVSSSEVGRRSPLRLTCGSVNPAGAVDDKVAVQQSCSVDGECEHRGNP